MTNNQCLWMKKLNYDFGNGAMFTILEQNYHILYKEIYKKYYWICIQNKRSNIHTITYNTVPYLPVPKLDNINYNTQKYDFTWGNQKSSIRYYMDNKDCAGIGNIRITIVHR